jgi:hypothetical protein
MTTALAKQMDILKGREIQMMKLGETLQKQGQESAFLQHHLSTNENIYHQFRA